MPSQVNVGLIGYAFMGRAHSFGYLNAGLFYNCDCMPVMKAICGRSEDAVKVAARRYGWQSYETDWKKLIKRDDIEMIDVSTPGNQHATMAIAAAQAGKHVFSEKPMANSLDDAKKMVAAVEKAGVKHMVGFNYRTVPAIALAKRLIDEGRIGTVYHWRAQYLQDWILDPEFPLIWRLQKKVCGSGALGDLAAHLIDTARMLIGEIDTVTATQETFIKERPLEAGAATLEGLVGRGKSAQKGKVDVDDGVIILSRFKNGALGTFEATRFSGGHKNYNFFEINGSKGSLRFQFEDMNVLEFWSADDPAYAQGFRKILATQSDHKHFGAYWPPGHIIGYGETFINEVAEFMDALAKNRMPVPSFVDGMKCCAVLDAITKSCKSGKWEKVPKV
ncbi:MAG TPA: Gfo/Idh/MocA family oxidoreductase [Candidatus Brocadiia bacterium]|nr:Gfo/Idh/MocA family oxidoreductase [Candidatus Brocadiia bacterium]